MKTQEFFSKYNGKFIDYDGRYGYQCVDLMRQYISEVLGQQYQLPPTDYAKNIFKNFTVSKYYQKIVNSPKNMPKEGDIIFWTTYPFVTGIAGHVAICSGGSLMQFISFDQNYPTNQPCKFVNHSYKGVLGWLRYKRKILF